MEILVDTREKPQAIGKILRQFDENGVKYARSKLFVGDYMSLSNAKFVIDRKQDLQELCGNVCQQHQRFKAELQRANDLGIKVCILCEHGGDIRSLEDVKNWINPRLTTSPKATKGTTLYKILHTLSWNYDVDFVFCKKGETGLKIIELLKEHGG
jgi:hypothetical protein